ncbi:MAG: hypothetical protein JSS02_35605 [Planctomycetes bacterium]|nr:hypothetical protein [Planctomycetota bacterium]
MFRKIGGHIPAKEMVNALARLRDRGQAHCELIATGGRPSECWFPDAAQQPIVPMPIAVSESAAEASLGVADATPAQTPAVPNEPVALPPMASLSLSELFDAVNAINGNFRHDGNSVIVDAPVGTITPGITAALAVHQEWLAEFYPAPMPDTDDAEAVNSDRVISEEAFLAELTSV